MENDRCPCGALCWSMEDGVRRCSICGLPEGAGEEALARLMEEQYPPVPLAVAPRKPTGPPSVRIRTVLKAEPGGLTLAELLHRTGLNWDELYATIGAGLQRRMLRVHEGGWRTGQGEKVLAGVRYAWRGRAA